MRHAGEVMSAQFTVTMLSPASTACSPHRTNLYASGIEILAFPLSGELSMPSVTREAFVI